ncbi:Heme-binding protein 2 [Nymphaea thermarum]|nr:Heme-binding protein 2 [Nymphaea thermarum]
MLTVLLFLLSVHQAVAIGNGGAAPYGIPLNCKSLECPLYEVVTRQSEFEIRHYKAPVWMSTPSINTTSYTQATSQGFGTLFAYIEGKNHDNVKIQMTVPVLIQVLPSTGPFCNSSFVVSFYVPKKYQTSPPLSTEVHAVRWPAGRYAAVRRFGGFMNETTIPMEAAALKQSLQGTSWASDVASRGKTPSTYWVAGYNSPFEYENRVNEVLFIFDK